METIDHYQVYVKKNYEADKYFEELTVATDRGTGVIEGLVMEYLKAKYGDDEYFISSIDFVGDLILDESNKIALLEAKKDAEINKQKKLADKMEENRDYWMNYFYEMKEQKDIKIKELEGRIVNDGN